MEADIYLLTDIKAPRKSDGIYTYQIRCFDSKGNERTIWDRKPIQTFKIENSTEYQAILVALIESLKRFNKPCDLNIYTDCDYIRLGVETWSHKWIENGWKSSKGKPIANEELWKSALELLAHYKATFHINEHHEYYNIMKDAIKKAKSVDFPQ